MGIVTTHKRWFVILTTSILTFLIMTIQRTNHYSKVQNTRDNMMIINRNKEERNFTKNWRQLTPEQIKNMSVLGRILFLQENLPKKRNKIFEILIWKYGPMIENRHLKHFSDIFINPFEDCSVSNCKITYENSAIKTADLVLFHLHRMRNVSEIPDQRNYSQIWTFLTDESPFNTFLYKNKLTNFNGLFNWSMTYRMDSDIPVPYGRTILNHNDLYEEIQFVKRRDVLVAIMGSNCGGQNNRWAYVKELQKFINVHIYGRCGTLKTCPGHFKKNCHDLDSYMFYLAFENSNCDEYVTEKLWWNAYEKQAIPIIMGASEESYQRLLPPMSYLNIEDYANPQTLANHILYLNKTGEYQQYYQWKIDFQILNEHGYFNSKSYHYCRICEALNYNTNEKKVYSNLSQFWSSSTDCHPPWKQ